MKNFYFKIAFTNNEMKFLEEVALGDLSLHCPKQRIALLKMNNLFKILNPQQLEFFWQRIQFLSNS